MEPSPPHAHRPGSIHSPFQGPPGSGHGGSLGRALGGPGIGQRTEHSRPGFLSQWEANQARAYQLHPEGQSIGGSAHLSYAPLEGYHLGYPSSEWVQSGDLLGSTSNQPIQSNTSLAHQHSTSTQQHSSSIYHPPYMSYSLPPPQPSATPSFTPAVVDPVDHQFHSTPTPPSLPRPLGPSYSQPSSIYTPYQPATCPTYHDSVHHRRYTEPGTLVDPGALSPSAESASASASGPVETEEGSDERTISSGVTEGGTVIKRERKKRRLKGEIPRDHESLGKYQCDECQARFARPSALATHIVSHNTYTIILDTLLTMAPSAFLLAQLTHTKEKRESALPSLQARPSFTDHRAISLRLSFRLYDLSTFLRGDEQPTPTLPRPETHHDDDHPGRSPGRQRCATHHLAPLPLLVRLDTRVHSDRLHCFDYYFGSLSFFLLVDRSTRSLRPRLERAKGDTRSQSPRRGSERSSIHRPSSRFRPCLFFSFCPSAWVLLVWPFSLL